MFQRSNGFASLRKPELRSSLNTWNHAESTYCGPQEPILRLDEGYNIRQHELINLRVNFGMTHDHRRQADDDTQCAELLLWGRSTVQVQRFRLARAEWQMEIHTRHQ